MTVIRLPWADTYAPPVTAPRDRATALVAGLHDELTTLFTTLDGGGAFIEQRWERPGGGEGVARILEEGVTFEKAGINRFVGGGPLPREAAVRLGARVDAAHEARFFAVGVSLVAHPRSPMIPTVHLNVRYFEIHDASGRTTDAWVGGGTDLTPMHPIPDDARFFHRALRDACGAHDDTLYPQFKRACDEYFVNHHRGGEARGIGGVFFDHLRPGDNDSGFDRDALFAFMRAIGASPASTYAPIVTRRRAVAWSADDRALQLARRGRYVEFNLLHDRGTLFGLQTGARIDSVLMSLPPLASWAPPSPPVPGSDAARLSAMLAPHDWAGDV